MYSDKNRWQETLLFTYEHAKISVSLQNQCQVKKLTSLLLVRSINKWKREHCVLEWKQSCKSCKCKNNLRSTRGLGDSNFVARCDCRGRHWRKRKFPHWRSNLPRQMMGIRRLRDINCLRLHREVISSRYTMPAIPGGRRTATWNRNCKRRTKRWERASYFHVFQTFPRFPDSNFAKFDGRKYSYDWKFFVSPVIMDNSVKKLQKKNRFDQHQFNAQPFKIRNRRVSIKCRKWSASTSNSKSFY